MKRKILLLAGALLWLANLHAQNIAINESNFPDENFRNYLLTSPLPTGNGNTFYGDYPYGSDGVFTPQELAAIVTIDVFNKNITDLTGIEHFTALTSLDCGANHLTSLDVSNNTALRWLRCMSNDLTSLDVSKNTALQYLSCYNNFDLTSLDVSGCTALRELYCERTQLLSLDVSKNTALERLDCYESQLSSLDVPKNTTALKWLSVGDNQLTSLDVSGCTALQELGCYRNQLPSLDVSKNTALTRLRCEGNQIPSLDVSKNTALTHLYCDNNQLDSLDVSNNTALTALRCNNNQLSSIDVSKHPALSHFRCNDNQLSSLDVSKNTALDLLWCQNNQLSALDVTKNIQLQILRCNDNQIPLLDLSQQTRLMYVYCHNNQIPALDLAKNSTRLIVLSCQNNQLTSLNLRATPRVYPCRVGDQTKIVNLESLDNHQKIGLEIIPSRSGSDIDFSTFSNLIVNGTATTVVKGTKDGKQYLVLADAATATGDIDFYAKNITYNQKDVYGNYVNLNPVDTIEHNPVLAATITSFSYIMNVSANSKSLLGNYYSGTIVLEYDAVVPADAEAYIITGLEATKREMLSDGTKHTFDQLTMVKIGDAGDVIPANTPIYVKAPTASGLYPFGRNLTGATPVTVPSGNLLKGSATDAVAVPSYGALTLGREKKTGEVGFWQNKATSIPAHRCYLDASVLDGTTTSSAKGAVFFFNDGETTSVSVVDSGECGVDGYFSLDGRRLNGKPTTKGVYIHNGRKEVIR